MIQVYMAISQESNPGRAGLGLCARVDYTFKYRARLVQESVTNFHAWWLCLEMALGGIAKRPAVIYTNMTVMRGDIEAAARVSGLFSDYRDVIERCGAKATPEMRVEYVPREQRGIEFERAINEARKILGGDCVDGKRT